MTQQQVERIAINFMTKYHYSGKNVKVSPDKVSSFANFAQVVFERKSTNGNIKKEIRDIFKAIDDIGE